MRRLNLGGSHRHQARTWKAAVRNMATEPLRTFRQGRRRFVSSGVLLADGVGMGKTYEALATAVGWLQRKGLRRQRWTPRVLVLVPPSLVRKWRDEVFLPDRWPKYLKQIESQTRIFRCFSSPVVIQRSGDLDELADRKYGRRLAGGFYVINWMQLGREGSGKWAARRRNLIKRTPWDVVIIDEAHLLPCKRVSDFIEVAGHKGTRIVLLTATPFQLNTGELKGLFANLFAPKHGGSGYDAAELIYTDEDFRTYRRQLGRAMVSGSEAKAEALRFAGRVKGSTEKLLRRLMLRNTSPQRRDFWIANRRGETRRIEGIAETNEAELRAELNRGGTIELTDEERYYYLAGLERLLPIRRDGELNRGQFDGFRHLLSSYANFRECKVGRTRLKGSSLEAFLQNSSDEGGHPRVGACVELVDRIVRNELKGLTTGEEYLGKTVIFVRFVQGTMAVLKGQIQKRLETVLGAHRKRARNHPYLELRKAVDSVAPQLVAAISECRPRCAEQAAALVVTLKKTLGKPDAKRRSHVEGYARAVARLALAGKGLGEEKSLLKARLAEARSVAERMRGIEDQVQLASLEQRLIDLLESLRDRYRARDLVQVISGGLRPEEAAAHRAAFNAPGAPLVLIASPVGQVGIDLQAYAEHVIHYELEWNPAKMEQREGRVDRLGRRGNGKVNVYYLICKDTYDERMLLQVGRRQLWHKLIVGRQQILQNDNEEASESVSQLDRRTFSRLALDLRPGRG